MIVVCIVVILAIIGHIMVDREIYAVMDRAACLQRKLRQQTPAWSGTEEDTQP